MDLKSTYNLIAEDWHKEHQNDDWWLGGTNKFVELLKPGDLILDAGCGGGTKSKYLINRGLKVVGIDFSEAMVAFAKREVPDGSFMLLVLVNVAELDQIFDGIFLQAVLLHIPKVNVQQTLGKLVQKLKSGGCLYSAVKEKKPKKLRTI